MLVILLISLVLNQASYRYLSLVVQQDNQTYLGDKNKGDFIANKLATYLVKA